MFVIPPIRLTFNNVETISIIINGEMFNNIDFSKIDKEYYKLKNQIIYQ